eukprot:scaffold82576_cov45-Phaeocystis_antarctica.AAC.1
MDCGSYWSRRCAHLPTLRAHRLAVGVGSHTATATQCIYPGCSPMLYISKLQPHVLVLMQQPDLSRRRRTS